MLILVAVSITTSITSITASINIISVAAVGASKKECIIIINGQSVTQLETEHGNTVTKATDPYATSHLCLWGGKWDDLQLSLGQIIH